MKYERHCWRLLVLGLIFGFILGGFVTGVVSFTLEEFIDGLGDVDLPHSVVIERNYDEVTKSSICFSCHLFLKYKRPCHYIQEFPKLAGHITKLNVFQKVGAHSWEIYDTVKIANINGVVKSIYVEFG